MSPAILKDNRLAKIKNSGVRVLVVSGPSGGHLFPALSFLDALKDSNAGIESQLVLPKRGIRPRGLSEDCSVKYISITPIRLSLSNKNLCSVLRFLQGSLESLIFLLKFSPKLVVGFGSIASIPMLLFAWLFRIKTLIHEQNVVCGRANRLLAKFVDKVAISFAETKNYLKINHQRIVLTGNPIRPELKIIEKKEALAYFGFSPDKFTILVMGGSQGSHSINAGFLKAVCSLSDSGRLQIIHLAGEKDQSLLRDGYTELKVEAKLFTFFEKMQYAYSAADLVICRGGATSIAELINFALPAIIIPYPFAYAHQLENARILENAGSAIVVNDQDLDKEVLQKQIDSLLENPSKLKDMHLAYKNITRPKTNSSLVKEALALMAD